ncbi:MAG: TIGR03087 family PEP-CTERM/XrtA system glycosyltransferase [Pseudomonadota bacterium]
MGDILFLTHRVPFPPNRGDKIRAHHVLAKLAQLGPVHVGCFADSDEDRMGQADLARITASHCVVDRKKPLALAGIEAVLNGQPVSLTAFRSARLFYWVEHLLAQRDIAAIVVFSGQMGQYVPPDYRGQVVIDLCDVDSAKFEDYADAGERVWLNRREARLLALEEQRLAYNAAATILISDAEATLFKSRLEDPSQASVHVIGNGIDAVAFDPAVTTPHPAFADGPGPHFVFTGQLDYRPNEQAALWAIESLLPVLRERFANAHFHIVGRNPTPALAANKAAPGVTLWGEVPDVRPFLAGADCILAPLLIARGVQNKVLEAMAMARPVLLTPEAATGIAARDGEHWLVSQADPAAMLKRFEKAWASPAERRQLGEAAREFVLRHHAWDAMLAPLDGLLSPALGVRDAA